MGKHREGYHKDYAQTPQRKKYLQKYFSDEEKRERRRIRRREWRQKKKLEVMAAYGGKCAKCGFDDHRALQFDHINGNGKQDRKMMMREEYYKFVLESEPGRFQLLCANCNWIKRWENKEYGL